VQNRSRQVFAYTPRRPVRYWSRLTRWGKQYFLRF
jgi:hypothetical protein